MTALACSSAGGGTSEGNSNTNGQPGTTGTNADGTPSTTGGTTVSADGTILNADGTPSTTTGTLNGLTAGSGTMFIEPTEIPETCGNGQLDGDEQCDDGNDDSLDGCNQACQKSPDVDCPTPGQLCVSNVACGDGRLHSTEACDDGGTAPDDGCAADCSAVDTGWQCRVPGRPCIPLCGDGIITATENCDDSNTASGDGCSSRCLTEPGWSCSAGVCVQSACGNETAEAGEACDKGPLNGLFYGDSSGCSKTCTAEPNCRDADGKTTACTTACGDGNIDPGETCDDGNAVDGDGCSALCAEEMGFLCETIEKTDTEACPPEEESGAAECLVLPITYRDFDGQNQATGHPDFFFLGASGTNCVPNASGNTDTTTAAGLCWATDSTDLCQGLVQPELGPNGKPVLGANTSCDCRFTDWDQTAVITGGTNCTVEGDGSTRTRIEKTVQVIDSAESFTQWYSDSTFSTAVLSTLPLGLIGGNQYQYSSSQGRTVYDDIHDIFLSDPDGAGAQPGTVTTLESGFFPLEDQTRPKTCNIWPYWIDEVATAATCRADEGTTVGSQWDPLGSYAAGQEGTGGPIAPVEGLMRNFYFTSEARYLFRYVGGETLAFYGDDDVWVFINGRLVLDLGAPHERLQGTIALGATGADWEIQSQDLTTGTFVTVGSGNVTAATMDMQEGNIYEIAIFHADRHPRESNYQLTLSGFSTNQSECTPDCGDGVATTGEECDDGADNANDVYGGCTTECTYGPYCGDGVLNGPEECDEGLANTAQYGEVGCASGCVIPHRCGDGIIDNGFGEECDDGDSLGKGDCDDECQLIVILQ